MDQSQPHLLSGFQFQVCVGAREDCSCDDSGQTQFLGRKIGREPVCLRICARASYQPSLCAASLWKAIGRHAWSPIQTMPGICPPARFSSLMCLFRDTVCLSDWASRSKPDVRVPLIGGALDTGPVWKGPGKSSLCTL